MVKSKFSSHGHSTVHSVHAVGSCLGRNKDLHSGPLSTGPFHQGPLPSTWHPEDISLQCSQPASSIGQYFKSPCKLMYSGPSSYPEEWSKKGPLNELDCRGSPWSEYASIYWRSSKGWTHNIKKIWPLQKGHSLQCSEAICLRNTHSIIPAITLDRIIAYDIVEDFVDTQQFIKFLKEHVVRSW